MTGTDTLKVGPFTIRPFLRDGAPKGQHQLDVPPRFAPGGKRKRIVFANRRAAEVEAKRMLREVQLTGRIAGFGPAPAGVTLTELAERWLKDQADRVLTQKKRASSLEADGYRLKALLAFFGPQDAATITDDRVVAYQRRRLDEGRKAPTINSETACLLKVMGWAQKKHLVERVPSAEPIPVHRPRLDLPTQEEVVRIIDALPVNLALLVRFLAETGCRKGEAFSLTWGDVNEARGMVSIRRKDGFTPKTEHSERDIYIGKPLMKALVAARRAVQPAPKDMALVFPGRCGKRMTNFVKAFAAAVKAAKVTRNGQPMHITVHMLRKCHATWQKMRGLDDSVLQPRLGHAPGSRITAQTYVHATDKALRGAILELPRTGRRSRAVH